MHWVDWVITAIPLIGVLAVAVYTQRFVRGVADYISAGRCAGRYLLTNAGGEAGSGVCNSVANIEKFMIKRSLFRRLVGIDNDFAKSDRSIAYFVFWFSLSMFGMVLFMLGWQFGLPRLIVLFGGSPETAEALRLGKHGWAVMWLWIKLIIPMLIALVTLVWFSVGGIKDMKDFFRIMKTRERDEHDDGTVHHESHT